MQNPPNVRFEIQMYAQNYFVLIQDDGLAHFHVVQLIKLDLGQSVIMTENRL